MLNINKLRNTDHSIIAIGTHLGILQSMLDFDYLAGKAAPSLVGIIASGRKYERLFWGKKDILIPVYASLKDIPAEKKEKITLFLNVTSGRRTLPTTLEALEFFPNLLGGSLFAENVPEKHSLEIYQKIQDDKKDLFVVGPASVGLVIPNILKLSAIVGTQAKQLVDSKIFTPGNTAVLSSSGGMTNELVRLLSQHGKHLSFSLAFGGDRFPVLTPTEAFLAAQADDYTDYIVYFGELGGYDEYDLAELLKNKQVTKKVIAYIAGSISDMFETPPQFGHAKAMASRGEETAKAKREVLQAAGAQVTASFTELIELVKSIKTVSNVDEKRQAHLKQLAKEFDSRKHALFVNSVSGDESGVASILGEPLVQVATQNSYSSIVASMLLGRKIKSKEMEQFADLILKLCVDHGPYVSGAVNTMITARAGKDLVSSLAAGLLTIGPRFGGAISEAAQNWLSAVEEQKNAYAFVEEFAKKRKLISGIGHRKYRIDLPDPRVTEILKFTESLQKKEHINFALEVQTITTAKKGNLILNVDGAIAAVMLDILAEKEHSSPQELRELVNIDFFNAFFVLSRAVGFTAHYLDQRRLDEGLFRLSPEDITTIA